MSIPVVSRESTWRWISVWISPVIRCASCASSVPAVGALSAARVVVAARIRPSARVNWSEMTSSDLRLTAAHTRCGPSPMMLAPP